MRNVWVKEEIFLGFKHLLPRPSIAAVPFPFPLSVQSAPSVCWSVFNLCTWTYCKRYILHSESVYAHTKQTSLLFFFFFLPDAITSSFLSFSLPLFPFKNFLNARLQSTNYMFHKGAVNHSLKNHYVSA